LIDGSLKSVLDSQKISDVLYEHSMEKLKDENCIYAFGDHMDIRKPHSKKMEDIGKVRDLEGKIINGFSSYAHIFLDESQSNLSFGDITTFSNRCREFVSKKEMKEYQLEKLSQRRTQEIQSLIETQSNIDMYGSIKRQYEQVHSKFKANNPTVKICYVNDRFCDSNEYFSFIHNELKEEFIVRVKKSRNSNAQIVNPQTNRLKYVKLIDLEFQNKVSKNIEKLVLKNKVYLNVNITFEWDTLTIDENKYDVVRVSVETA
jgi:hypothetical protein